MGERWHLCGRELQHLARHKHQHFQLCQRGRLCILLPLQEQRGAEPKRCEECCGSLQWRPVAISNPESVTTSSPESIGECQPDISLCGCWEAHGVTIELLRWWHQRRRAWLLGHSRH